MAPTGRLGTGASRSSGSSAMQPLVQPTSSAVVSSQDPTVQQAARELKEFLNVREGSALRAWLQHFDLNNDQKISQFEFNRGMRKMGYTGDVPALFATLDTDNSGELSLEEIDLSQAVMWRRFRAWCVERFEGAQDMLNHLGGLGTEELDVNLFTGGVRRVGWDEGFEDVLFSSLDADSQGLLQLSELKWLEVEKRRQRRKEQARRRAQQELKARTSDWKAAAATLTDFRQFLRRRYGSYLRAWRTALSPDGSMVLQKGDLFKACSSIGWPGEVRALYKAFDKDDSGYISIEELDARSAEVLAHFRAFAERRFGSAAETFRALDKHKTKTLRFPEFQASLKSFGFEHPVKLLFHGLDTSGTKSIVEEDLLFLDRWRAPAFLIAPPNPQAAEEVKALLLRDYKNYLKAWRHVLDVDSSNHCSYDEFEAACKRIGYGGDVSGAWRSLDADLSGFITLHEIDPVASDTLLEFRRWCDEEFGSVRSAFSVFDHSGDGQVSYSEFRRSCRIYGYEGSVRTLFYALDSQQNGTLSVEEVIFLDDWEFHDGVEFTEGPSATTRTTMDSLTATRASTDTVDYVTFGPGPGKYRPPTTVGAPPKTPMVHFSGAYSFRQRTYGSALPGLHKTPEQPSPASYDDSRGRSAVQPTKPAWAFGKERRHLAPPKSPQPGPGHYSPGQHRGQTVVCTPRRPLRVHPLTRECHSARGVRREEMT